MDYDVAVIGSGPAGAEVARLVALSGLETALITASPPGGRTTVGSLLPSKVWLHIAHHHHNQDRLNAKETQRVAARVRSTIERRSHQIADELREAGVSIIRGTARLRSPGTLEVDGNDRPLRADRIVLAGGSEPLFAPGVRPTGSRILAPRHTKEITEIPESMIMVGGGITGVEYASAFARLGSEVTLLARRRILPSWDREYVERWEDYLSSIGVDIHGSSEAVEARESESAVEVVTAGGESFRADYAFIATGRSADLASLSEDTRKLRDMGLETRDGFIVVDENGETSLEGVYACGDTTGAPLVANKALLEARRVAYSISGGTTGTKPQDTPLIEAVYTQPQLAQIGSVPGDSTTTQVPGEELRIERRSYERLTLSHIHTEVTPGEIKAWVTSSGKIAAAAAIGENAADVLAPVQLAMHHGIAWNELVRTPFAYPTLTEVITT